MPRPRNSVESRLPRSAASTRPVGMSDGRRQASGSVRGVAVRDLPELDAWRECRAPESAAIRMSPTDAVVHPRRERTLLR